MLYKQMINRTHQDNRHLETKINQFDRESQMAFVNPEEEERLRLEREEVQRLENQLRSTHVERFQEYEGIQWAPQPQQGGHRLNPGEDIIPQAMKKPYQEHEAQGEYQNFGQSVGIFYLCTWFYYFIHFCLFGCLTFWFFGLKGFKENLGILRF